MTIAQDTSTQLLQKIKSYAQAIDAGAEVILFGSRARGVARDDSDWDILILVPGPVTLQMEQAFRHKLFDLELEYGQAISTFVYSKTDWAGRCRVTPLYRSVIKEGIAL